MDDTNLSNHRQFNQIKLLVLLLAFLALAALVSWVIAYGGGTDRLRALLSAPTPVAALPTLSAVEQVARTATAEAQATEAAGAAVIEATQTAAAQATAMVEVQAVATQTTVAIVQPTQTAVAMPEAEEATSTPAAEVAVEPTSTPEEAATPEAEATPSPTEKPEEAATPEITATPLPTETPEGAVVPEAVQPQEFQYTVRYGDTLMGLARRLDATVADIVNRNNLTDPNRIRIGQTLAIFGMPRGAPMDYVVRPGDTLWAIAGRFNTTVRAIAQLNHIANPNRIRAGQSLHIVPGALAAPLGDPVYTVRRGDTLSAIAFRYGTTPWAIAIANNLPNPHLIFPGQALRIP